MPGREHVIPTTKLERIKLLGSYEIIGPHVEVA